MGSVSMSMKERFDVSQPLTTGLSARGLGGLSKIATALHPIHRKCNLIFQHAVHMTLLTREKSELLSYGVFIRELMYMYWGAGVYLGFKDIEGLS